MEEEFLNNQPVSNQDIIEKKEDKSVNYLQMLRASMKSAVFYIFMFSAAVNLIMLILPIYTLQVFDRVLSSGSIETLVSLTVIAAFLFVIFGIFTGIREIFLIKISGWLEEKIGKKLFKISVNHSSVTGDKIGSTFFNDANTVKNFITSPAIFSLFDIPWSFVFIFVIYLISPQIALMVGFGAIILFGLTVLREFRNKPYITETNQLSNENMRRADEYIRNSETLEAMGMLPEAYDVWQKNQSMIIERNTNSSTFSSVLNAFSKSLRMMLQISIIGYGSYLALSKEMTFGGIIACSILSGRALAPFDALTSIWSNLGVVKDSYARLNQFFSEGKERPKTINFDKPSGNIELDKVVFMRPGATMPVPIIKGVSFKVEAGDVVGVIGPSASGKSTLVKLVAGIYKPFQGQVKIDGGDVYMRNREELGKHIGYLPQSIDLLNGSIKDNIARFDPEAEDADVIKAAKATGVHELILSFPDGYNTMIGEGTTMLSGGQKQRIALARAFFGDPQIIILDEPNANLDEVGERMLLNAIVNAKKEGKTVFLIAHKPAIVNITSKIVVIRDGQVMDFGDTAEIITKYARSSQKSENYKKAKETIQGKTKEETNGSSEEKRQEKKKKDKKNSKTTKTKKSKTDKKPKK